MNRDVKILLIALLLTTILLTGTALASMPATRGAAYPHTVYLDRGIKGSVSGKVVSSMDQNTGVAGAYVGVVSALNPGVEYANTTTDANGNYNIGGLGATYSSTRHTGSDGTSGTLVMSMDMLMLYVNKSDMNEQYSSTFGIDANHTSTHMDPIVLYAGVPDSDVTITPTPAPTIQPTVVVPTVVVPTPEPATATPEPSPVAGLPTTLILVVAALIILAIAIAVVYFKFLRARLFGKPKKK